MSDPFTKSHKGSLPLPAHDNSRGKHPLTDCSEHRADDHPSATPSSREKMAETSDAELMTSAEAAPRDHPARGFLARAALSLIDPQRDTTPDVLGLFDTERGASREAFPSAQLFTFCLGLLGSAVISWITLGWLLPWLAHETTDHRLAETWVRVVATLVCGLLSAVILQRLDGTIWGRYFAVLGYLLSAALLILMALHYFRVW